MAEVIRNVGRVFRLSSTVAGEGTNICVLGDVSDGESGSITVVIVPGAGYAGSITVKARSRNPEAAQPLTPPMPAAFAFEPIPYVKLSVAGAAINPAAWDAAALVGKAIIQIPASGLSIALDATITGGDAWVFWTPCVGDVPHP